MDEEVSVLHVLVCVAFKFQLRRSRVPFQAFNHLARAMSLPMDFVNLSVYRIIAGITVTYQVGFDPTWRTEDQQRGSAAQELRPMVLVRMGNPTSGFAWFAVNNRQVGTCTCLSLLTGYPQLLGW